MAAEVIGTKGLDFIEYHQLLKISLPSKKNDNREEKKVDTSDKSQRHDVRIKIKIDQQGLAMFKLYFLISQACLREIFPFYKR